MKKLIIVLCNMQKIILLKNVQIVVLLSKKIMDAIISLVLNVNINGVGYVIKNMKLAIIPKENVKDFNFLNLKMNMK